MVNKTKKKILFLITKSNWGGAQRYIYDLAVTLDQNIYEPVVALGGDGTLKGMLEEAGVRVIQIPGLQRDISLQKEVASLLHVGAIIRAEKPDVLHVNSSKAGGIGAFLGRVLFVPRVVFTAHGWAFNEDRPEWQKTIIKFFHWLTVLLSHATIAVSNGMKAEMDWPFVQSKMSVINPGRGAIDMKYREEARSVLESKVTGSDHQLSNYHTDFWIGTIAELHPIKRLNRAIDSVASLTKQFPNIRLVIIHDGELRAQLEQQVADLGLQEHVFFTGVIMEASRFLPAFDLFVLPSKSESFGYVLIEAGLASLPVVATEVGGITDVITHNENGLLVEPDNTPALTSALSTLIENKDLRHDLARAHFEKSKTFTIEKMTSATLDVYNG